MATSKIVRKKPKVIKRTRTTRKVRLHKARFNFQKNAIKVLQDAHDKLRELEEDFTYEATDLFSIGDEWESLPPKWEVISTLVSAANGTLWAALERTRSKS
jgi:hypothetical protein